MKTPRFGISGLALALLLLATTHPASAQYIFLDSNGDGVHTAADELHGVGPTVVDIWLDTGHNRDGSATVCAPVPATPLTMFSYEVNLRAVGGTVSYSTFTNKVPQMGLLIPAQPPNTTQFGTGSYYAPIGTSLPPSRYLLGTLTINVTSGMPSIQFVPLITWPSGWTSYTLFGSYCDGT